ncbi:MAG: glycosyltransferase family 2 protein [Candidatus Omnitrophota bacterium]
MTPSASVIILTKNAGSVFQKTLDQIFSQHLKPLEVLVIDSGSTDGTVDLVQRYPVRLLSIKPEEFGHGRTRNLGARLAKGEFLVFLTQDAIPTSEDWLSALVAPFMEDERLAGVYGRQVPRGADPLETFCRRTTYPPVPYRHCARDLLTFSVFHLLFSNVNAAVRKDFWTQFPFDEQLIVSEDQAWARRVLQKGHEILYESRAAVFHAHQGGPIQRFKRSFDSGISFQQMAADGTLQLLPKSGSYLVQAMRYLMREGQGVWIPLLFPREMLRAGGFLMGRYGRNIPKQVKQWLSAHPQYWTKP